MHAYIIIETDKIRRDEEIDRRLKELRVSPYDRIVPETDQQTIGISDIRRFIRSVSLSPRYGSITAGIITQADHMTEEAQQALLKTLEEPPPSACIFLGVSNASALIPTIRSRCVSVSLSANPSVEVTEPNRTAQWIENVLSSSHGQRFRLIEKVGTTRNEYAVWMDDLLSALRQDIMKKRTETQPNGAPKSHKVKLLRSLLSLRRYVSVNVSPQHLIECALLAGQPSR